jgi:hypothetical protein
MYTHLYPNFPLSTLNKRKLAGMKSRRVGIVPYQARDRDVIVYLAGECLGRPAFLSSFLT